MPKLPFLFLSSGIMMMAFYACTKKDQVNAELHAEKLTPRFSYPDSIIYLKNVVGDYIVKPVNAASGTYTAFPDGIELDDITGAINVSESETGLRYRITYTSPQGISSTTSVVLSGMNFKDKFYRLSQGDSLALPIYNATIANVLPVSGSVFDDGRAANEGGCAVKTNNGQINLRQTIRNGVFGNIPKNNVRKDFDIFYRLNDRSGKSLNKLKVRVYYYNSMADVAPDLIQTLQDREDQGVFLESNPGLSSVSTARTNRAAKPRPPCIILIAN